MRFQRGFQGRRWAFFFVLIIKVAGLRRFPVGSVATPWQKNKSRM